MNIKKRYLIALGVLLYSSLGLAQSTASVEKVSVSVERANFVGGNDLFYKWNDPVPKFKTPG